MILGKYNQSKTITFDLVAPDGVDLITNATFATGDVVIMSNEGAEANTTNLPTDEGTGYSLVLTAAEMSTARIRVYIIDQTATKIWLDTSYGIETYGNASAEHAFDLDTANVTLAAVTHTGATIPVVSTLTNLPAITTNWLTAAGIAASALDGKGDWNIGKTGYALTQAFPTNFADQAITATTGLVSVGTNNDKSGYSISGTKTTLDSLNDLTAAQVNAEVDTALNTAIPGSPTADSINERLATVDDDWNDGGRLDLLLDRLITELDTARGEPAQGAPAASTKIGDKIDYLYKAWRNTSTQTATTYSLYDDAGTTVDHKSTDSDDGTTATKGEILSGP